jgi:hypothetical protein
MFHYDEEVCQKCGGDCCKRMPGCAIPDDIAKLFPAETIQESVKQALMSKNIPNNDVRTVHRRRV